LITAKRVVEPGPVSPCQRIHSALYAPAWRVKAQSIKHDFLSTNTIFDNSNEIAATFLYKRGLSR
jgi:hypothetical protein